MQKLSICIPTYNRDSFLAWTLERTAADFPDAKIIVSDNAKSTLPMNGFRYIRQPTNIGAFPNMRAALLASHTQYAVFLGDDDYLLPEEVQKAFVHHDAQQCGFCTPGFVVACTAFVRRHPNATLEQVRAGLGGNLCRCGTYAGMMLAVVDAARKGVS